MRQFVQVVTTSGFCVWYAFMFGMVVVDPTVPLWVRIGAGIFALVAFSFAVGNDVSRGWYRREWRHARELTKKRLIDNRELTSRLVGLSKLTGQPIPSPRTPAEQLHDHDHTVELPTTLRQWG